MTESRAKGRRKKAAVGGRSLLGRVLDSPAWHETRGATTRHLDGGALNHGGERARRQGPCGGAIFLPQGRAIVAGARVAGPGRRARAAKGSGGCVVKKKGRKERNTAGGGRWPCGKWGGVAPASRFLPTAAARHRRPYLLCGREVEMKRVRVRDLTGWGFVPAILKHGRRIKINGPDEPVPVLGQIGPRWEERGVRLPAQAQVAAWARRRAGYAPSWAALQRLQPGRFRQSRAERGAGRGAARGPAALAGPRGKGRPAGQN
jgi:hypothetical protein